MAGPFALWDLAKRKLRLVGEIKYPKSTARRVKRYEAQGFDVPLETTSAVAKAVGEADEKELPPSGEATKEKHVREAVH